jgi:ParB family chromosome partitioning protein
MRHDAHYVEAIAQKSRAIGKTISIELIEPNPVQPRSEFGDLKELTASIKEKGVLEPLLVKAKPEGGWMIIAGERRWRASKAAGLKEVPCIEIDADEKGIAEIALIENLQRKDLNVWEEADGLLALANKFGYTQDDIAQKISKSRSTVTEFMSIAGLPEEIRVKCRDANISSKSTLLEVARQFDDKAMHEFLDALISGEKTPRSKQSKTVTLKPQTSRTEALKPTSEPVNGSNGFAFTYSGRDPNFELKLTFENQESAGRGEILRALKQAFDSVKEKGD